MKLRYVTITGADDSVDPQNLKEISARFPFVEWAILLSSTKATETSTGSPRYPSNAWLQKLVTTQFNNPAIEMNLAAHLCGRTMREFMTDITFDNYSEGWCVQHGITEAEYNRAFYRTQANFNAEREGYTQDHIAEMMRGWYESMDGNIITQHNRPNDWVWEVAQKCDATMRAYKPHQVLHDASGGRGEFIGNIPQPIAGILNGYAGGIGPDNVIDTLKAIDDVVELGYVWIDMETKVRDENDQFDLDAIVDMLEDIAMHKARNNW